MKCLTILQPYAHLVMLPDDNDLAKRVENRTWPTTYRGPLLIHAGKSNRLLKLNSEGMDEYGINVNDMVFGAIVGVCQLADCRSINDILAGRCGSHRWLIGHEHTEGPWCWVLTECRKFDQPIPLRGLQGLFDVSDELVRQYL